MSTHTCEHCGAQHENEFSLTCGDCDTLRESGDLEMSTLEERIDAAYEDMMHKYRQGYVLPFQEALAYWESLLAQQNPLWRKHERTT